mmetsp:Transcript_38192/g.121336  ORF Transcript_38192/g.121336 Transcript_38192/m.121336 type:complete len:231 (+) Transcript_38192:317-1009(+)
MYWRSGSECFSSRAYSSRLICSRRSSCSFLLFLASASARASSSTLACTSSLGSSSAWAGPAACAGGRKLITDRLLSTVKETFAMSSSKLTSLASSLRTPHSNFCSKKSSSAGPSSGFSFFHRSILSWNSFSTTGFSLDCKRSRQVASVLEMATTMSGATDLRGTFSASGAVASSPSRGSGGGGSSRKERVHSSNVCGYPLSTNPRYCAGFFCRYASTSSTVSELGSKKGP